MQQNPTGVVDRETFIRLTTSACGADAGYMFGRIFDVWDSNRDGSVDFKEFITSTSVMLHGDLEQKLRCMFALFHKPALRMLMWLQLRLTCTMQMATAVCR